MQTPLEITFRGMAPSEAVEARIREKVAWLERFYDGITGCNVVVEAPHHHSRKGNLFAVSIELSVPGGPSIVAGRVHHDDHAHEDVYVAIRDTFDAARRRLQDHVGKREAM
jgi:ribosomal subunit interface protein